MERISDTAELTVFCTCPGCIDLAEVFSDGEGNLYGTAICCTGCSKARLEVGDGQV